MSNIVTATEYNAYLGTADTSQDTQKTALIGYAQGYAQQVLGLTFQTGTLTERYTVRPGQQTIQLRTVPVTSVTSIKAFYGTGTNDYNTLSTDWYYVNLATGVISIYAAGRNSQIGYDPQGFPYQNSLTPAVIGQLPAFYPGVDNHEIVYVAGQSSIPDGLKLCMFQAIDYLKSNAGTNPEFKSESIGAYSYDCFKKNPIVADMIKSIFSPYAVGAFLL